MVSQLPTVAQLRNDGSRIIRRWNLIVWIHLWWGLLDQHIDFSGLEPSHLNRELGLDVEQVFEFD